MYLSGTYVETPFYSIYVPRVASTRLCFTWRRHGRYVAAQAKFFSNYVQEEVTRRCFERRFQFSELQVASFCCTKNASLF